MPKCFECESRATVTINHHKPDQDAVSYAFRCDAHKDGKLASLKLQGLIVSYGPTCVPCSGTGKQPRFNHVQRGVCFRCKGSGIMGKQKGVA